MKKTLRALFFTVLNFAIAIPSTLAFYVYDPESDSFIDCSKPKNLNGDQKVLCLFGNESELIEASPQGSQTGTSLPSGDVTGDFLPFFINTALSITGTMVFIAIVYAGYLLVFVNDKEEKIEKGKKILTYAIIGAFVVAISYAVILGISQLDLD